MQVVHKDAQKFDEGDETSNSGQWLDKCERGITVEDQNALA